MMPNTGKSESHATDEVYVAPDPIPSFPMHAPYDPEAQAAARSRIDDIFAEVEEELRLEAERVERERAEAELRARLERERLEAERLAREEAERLEAERLEAERLAREEAERLEAERKAREEAERLEREAAEAARREELARQLAAASAASHMAAIDEETFARLEDRPRRGAHFAMPAAEGEGEEVRSIQAMAFDERDLDAVVDAYAGADVDAPDYDDLELDELDLTETSLTSMSTEPSSDSADEPEDDSDHAHEGVLDYEAEDGCAGENEDDYEDVTTAQIVPAPAQTAGDEHDAYDDAPASNDEAVAPVDESYDSYEQYEQYEQYEPNEPYVPYEPYEPYEPNDSHEPAEEAPATGERGVELANVLAGLFGYGDLDEAEDPDGHASDGGRGIEAPRPGDVDEYDGLDEVDEGAGEQEPQPLAEPTEAVSDETQPEEDDAEDAPSSPEDADAADAADANAGQASDGSYGDFDDVDDPEVVVIYDEAQIEEATVVAPTAGADPGLDATLVLDRVADAVKKLRVEGESAPIVHVREQSSDTVIHTEYQVSEDDKERLEVVRRDVTSAKGRQNSGFFARIGAFVVKTLHLDER